MPFLFFSQILCFMAFLSFAHAQELHFKNTRKYLTQNQVIERSTWDITTKTPSKISIDKFDTQGNKIEATEVYEGNRFLSKFINGKWTNIHTTTHFSFKYNKAGLQIEQFNHNFNAEQQNEMYQYDAYGNIQRWFTGRSFQLPQRRTTTYDSYGSVLEEQNCWSVNCEKANFNTTIKHHLKYNQLHLLIEDFVNFVDGMSGYIYEYTLNANEKIAHKKQYFVNSYNGLDHEIPTEKDIDKKTLYHEWAYNYNDKGLLTKEIWTEHWTGDAIMHQFIYNEMGLVIEHKTNNSELITYTYNNKGLVLEEQHYNILNGNKRLLKKLKFEYVFKK